MKTILVPFYDDAFAQAALDTACVIAEKSAGHIEGLFVLRPPQIFDGEGIALAGSYMSQLKEEGQRLAVKARERFDLALQQRNLPLADMANDDMGMSASWREVEGLEGQVVADYGRAFDLIVIGRGFGQPWIDWNLMCDAALFESGRPVIVAPEKAPTTVGKKVVIGWNGSAETARTVAFSMPLLAGAEEVFVVTVDGWLVPGPSGEQLTQHLRRNGINATARAVAADSRNPGEVVLAEVEALGADLLVKGAYTQGRLRQLVFGGATRHILGAAQIPVLLAH